MFGAPKWNPSQVPIQPWAGLAWWTRAAAQRRSLLDARDKRGHLLYVALVRDQAFPFADIWVVMCTEAVCFGCLGFMGSVFLIANGWDLPVWSGAEVEKAFDMAQFEALWRRKNTARSVTTGRGWHLLNHQLTGVHIQKLYQAATQTQSHVVPEHVLAE